MRAEHFSRVAGGDLGFSGDGTAEVYSKLTDVDKGVVVRGWRVNAAQLHQGAPHELDGRQSLGCGQLAAADKSHVKSLWEGQGV